MRVRLLLGSLGLLALFAPVVLTGCSSSTSETAAPEDADGGTSTGLPAADGGQSSDGGAGGGGDGAGKPKNDCKLADIKGVVDVTPAFAVYGPPNAIPPTMTGGTLSGKYTVDSATVFLPSGSAGLADPSKSTGTINAWAVFDGTNYRLYLKAAFTISTVVGPQSQGADTASQGAFVASGATLTLDHACDTALASEADYTFTDNGGGRATILIKTPTTYGDTYMQLDAAKN
jgi:hypothetical protein